MGVHIKDKKGVRTSKVIVIKKNNDSVHKTNFTTLTKEEVESFRCKVYKYAF